MKYITNILLLIFIAQYSQGLNTDSLTNVFRLADNEAKINTAYKLANYWYDNKDDSALYFLDYIINHTKKETTDTTRGYALKLKGNLYLFEKAYFKAEQHYREALEIFENSNDQKGIDAALNNLGLVMIRRHKYDEAVNLLNKSIDRAEKKGDKFSMAQTYHNLGYIYELKSENAKALEHYLKALQIKRQFSDSASVSSTLNNIGNIYDAYHDYEKALEYYEQSLAISRYLKDSGQIAVRYYNIARIYKKMHQYENSMEYYLAALRIHKSRGNKSKISRVHNSLGILYDLWNKYDDAIKHYNKALSYLDQNKDTVDCGRIYFNLAELYERKNQFKIAGQYYKKAIRHIKTTELFEEKHTIYLNYASLLVKQKAYDKAKSYFAEAIKMARKKGDNNQLAKALVHYSNMFYTQNQYSTAINLLKTAAGKVANTNAFEIEKTIYNHLYKNYKRSGRYRQALYYYERARQMQDSIYKEKRLKNMMELEKKYDLKQKEKEILLLSSKNKLQALENTAQKIKLKNVTLTRNFAFAAGFLLLLLVIISFYAFLSKRKANKQLRQYNAEITEQKEEITAQRDEIETQFNQIDQQKEQLLTQQKDITSSITYAQYIQQSIFPADNFFKQHFKEWFIFYRPKDIVSGDFYFGEQSGDDIFIAVVDCTGHGVPGAFMSMLGYNALRTAIIEKQLKDPARILEQIDLQIKNATHSSTEIAGSGMDMILVKISHDRQELEAAGAKRPLIIFREGELNELATSKRSIGRTRPDKQNNFATIRWKLRPYDKIYMFTDGFVDQFGGADKKKFKTPQLKNKLYEVQNMPLDEQKNVLIRTFDNWKGSNEQIDDVLILGIQI